MSDIWAFWYYLIKKYIKKEQKNKNVEKELLSYLEQSKYFYESAEESPVKSKPLLYYYSFLNFSKIIYIFKNGLDNLSVIKFTHGISEVYNRAFNKSEISIKTSKKGAVQLAHEIFKIFDDNAPAYDSGSHSFNIRDLLSHCVGVHRAYIETFYKKRDEGFIKIKNYYLFRIAKKIHFIAYLGYLKDGEFVELKDNGYDIIYFNKNESCQNVLIDFNLNDSGYYLNVEMDIGHNNKNLTKGNYRELGREIRKKRNMVFHW